MITHEIQPEHKKTLLFFCEGGQALGWGGASSPEEIRTCLGTVLGCLPQPTLPESCQPQPFWGSVMGDESPREPPLLPRGRELGAEPVRWQPLGFRVNTGSQDSEWLSHQPRATLRPARARPLCPRLQRAGAGPLLPPTSNLSVLIYCLQKKVSPHRIQDSSRLAPTPAKPNQLLILASPFLCSAHGRTFPFPTPWELVPGVGGTGIPVSSWAFHLPHYKQKTGRTSITQTPPFPTLPWAGVYWHVTGRAQECAR